MLYNQHLRDNKLPFISGDCDMLILKVIIIQSECVNYHFADTVFAFRQLFKARIADELADMVALS